MLARELGGDLVDLAEPPDRDQERLVAGQARRLEVGDLLAQVSFQFIRVGVGDRAPAQDRGTPGDDLGLE